MAEFQSDGCTAFPDSILGVDLTPCCLAHDEAYWYRDGTKADADAALYQCVAETIAAAHSDAFGFVSAMLMLAGVSTFGWIFWRRGKRGTR